MTIYRGVGGVNREIKQQFRGLGGVNREIKEQWRGAGGVNRKVFNKDIILASGVSLDFTKLAQNAANWQESGGSFVYNSTYGLYIPQGGTKGTLNSNAFDYDYKVLFIPCNFNANSFTMTWTEKVYSSVVGCLGGNSITFFADGIEKFVMGRTDGWAATMGQTLCLSINAGWCSGVRGSDVVALAETASINGTTITNILSKSGNTITYTAKNGALTICTKTATQVTGSVITKIGIIQTGYSGYSEVETAIYNLTVA